MNRNKFWKFVFVVLIVTWALYEIYPPRSRDLVEHFATRAARPDATLTEILERARAMQAERPDRDYGNLQDAIGTNDITYYFPFFDTTGELNPNQAILNRLQREAAGKIKLGLDLRGGTSFLMQMDTNRLEDVQDLDAVLSQAVEVLRKRVDKFGVAEPVIQPAGNNRILVQLPGLSQAERETAITTIQRAAFLEFRMVHEQSDDLVENNEIPPGHELLQHVQRQRDGSQRIDRVIVRKRAELTGSAIRSAQVVRGNLGEPEIDFSLTSEGAAIFADLTRENVGRRLAIILDGELYSAPVIQSAIETGRGQITGSFDLREAHELANVLENPLRAPLELVYSSDVDPTLGRDSVRSGIRAAIYGLILVSVFMLVYYLLAGLVANVALVLNIIILLGVMCSIGTTLTLPGIAGILLTIGMAVDANVLIFERIREEVKAGKSMRGALSSGYDKAFSTIFDTNVTTLISAIILIFMGTGPVKGFGVTLTIGIAVSMFTALVVTRLLFEWMIAKEWLKNLKMLAVLGHTRLDFLRWAVPAFAASWLLILVGTSYGLFSRGANVLGVEFVGGETITLAFDQSKDIGVDQIRSSVGRVGIGEALIAYQRDISTGDRTLRITVRGQEAAEAGVERTGRVIEQIQTDFADAEFRALSVDQVGPTVGRELRNTAIYALLLAMFGILVYVAFRYEFSFAVAAVVALLHDLLMTLGIYFLSGREMNVTMVAALMTIMGFSINDTIVIFDRIREDLKLGVRGSFREVMNLAINQTLSRTIITSGTTFLATLCLFIFGGGPVNDFAFTFLIGIVVGTYSTIYIATAIVLWWHKGHRPALGSQVAVEGGAAPMAAKA
jgi:SecD/SecF fusion protein